MNSSVSRARRHQQILELVRSEPIASQEALAEALEAHGHRVTQSTLSRDLRELRVLRVPQAGGYRYLPAGEEAVSGRLPNLALARVAAAEVMRVSANEVSVIVRTQTGRAPGVAAYLDALDLEDVLATVAGDDTVLVIPASIEQSDPLARRLADLFELPPATSHATAPRRSN